MTAPSDLPAALRQRLTDFVMSHAAAAPGLLTGVVVTGSAATGDWRPGLSDIDAVFLTSRVPNRNELEPLAALHASTVADGPIDGVYLTEEQLAAGPGALASAPQVVEGELNPDQPGAQLTWVTWREIETGMEATVTAAGRLGDWRPSGRSFVGSDNGVRDFSRQNLHDYWAPLVADVTAQLSGRPDAADVNAATFRWVAFGPARLAVTIETGRILSKTAAASYAAERWPRFAPLLQRAIASRAGSPESFTAADAREALQLARDVIAAYPAAAAASGTAG